MNESTIISSLSERTELIALLILIAGLILARLASVITGRVLGVLEQRAARYATTDTTILSPKVIRVTRAFMFWVVLAVAVSYALHVLGIGGISSGLDSVFEYAPKVLVAFSIVIVGHLFGLIASHLVARLDDDMSSESFAPRLVYGVIIAVAIVMGLQHISIDISFVTRLVFILIGTVSAGLMLAFALGARQHVANLLARHELARLAIGQRVRIDGVEGVIVEIHTTGLDIATDEGIASVPAARLSEVGVLRIVEGTDDAHD